MHSVWQDLRYGLRGLRRELAFTLLAVLTLGLGIGAATTIFSVIQNVLPDPYPYAEVDRNVTIEIRDARSSRPGGRSFLKTPEFLDYQEQIQSFEEVIAGGFEDVLYTTGEGTEQFNGGLMMPEAFIPYTVTGAFERGVLVKTAGSPLAMLNGIRREIWAVDRNVALTNTGSLTDYLRQFSYAEPRFGLVVLGVFAGVGLVLVVLGVFSVVAYTVSRQTHEIGIRMALGAVRADVLGMVLRMGLRLIAMGIAVGVGASLGVSRVLSSQLFGIAPHDPPTLLAVVTVVALAGFLACYLPARLATRVDPMVALRYE